MELKCDISGPTSTPEIALDNAAIRAELANNLRRIKTGSYTEDHGSHFKHFSVSGVAHVAAAALERATTHEQQLKGECLMLADVLRDAYEVVKTIEGEDSDECDKLQDLRMSMEYALAMYDDRRIKAANANVTGTGKRSLPGSGGQQGSAATTGGNDGNLG